MLIWYWYHSQGRAHYTEQHEYLHVYLSTWTTAHLHQWTGINKRRKNTICCVASTKNENGTHNIDYIPTHSGDFSLTLQAIWPGGLLANFWDNSFFQGEPTSSSQMDVNMYKGGRAIVGFSSDYVSARFIFNPTESKSNQFFSYSLSMYLINFDILIWFSVSIGIWSFVSPFFYFTATSTLL